MKDELTGIVAITILVGGGAAVGGVGLWTDSVLWMAITLISASSLLIMFTERYGGKDV